jgi:microcystin-dependent protein
MSTREGLSKLALDLQPFIKTQMLLDPDIMQTGGTPAPLGTPSWVNGYPRQVGEIIYAQWYPVPRAATYEIWRNSTAAFSGAVKVIDVGLATAISFPCNVARNSQVNTINPGFESGDLTGYDLSYTIPPVGETETCYTISTTERLSGTYSCRFHPIWGEAWMKTVPYAVLPSEKYTIQVPINITNGYVASNNDIYCFVNWLRAGSALTTVTLHHWEDVTSGWESVTQTLTAPADAEYVYLAFSADCGLIATPPQIILGYLDDILIYGPEPAVPDNQLYAVRALDEDGNESNTSGWLRATQASSALGSRSSAYLQFDPTGKVQSSVAGSPPVAYLDAYGYAGRGWSPAIDDAVPPARQKWTYVDSTHIQVDQSDGTGTDLTMLYIAGLYMEWQQGGGAYKIARVVSSTYASSHTTAQVVMLVGSLTNATIDTLSNYYSRELVPESLPVNLTLGAANPLADGTAAPGTALVAAREDHVHPNAAASGFSTGDYKWSAIATPATGWLLCNGKTIGDASSAANYTGDDYHALYDAIQATYGGTYNWAAHNAVNLPDWRGRSPFGVGTHADVDSIADNDGQVVANRTPKHVHGYTDVPNHTHPINYTGGYGAGTDGLLAEAGVSGHLNSDNPNGGVTTGVTGFSNAAYGTAYVFIKT